MILKTAAHQLGIARYLAATDNVLGTAIDLTSEGDFAQKPTADVANGYLGAFDISKTITNEIKANGVAFGFIGTGGENYGFKWRLYTWRSGNGCARYVAAGTGTLGTQEVVRYPHNSSAVSSAYWADTLTVDWYNWYKQITSTDTTGHNTQAEIWLDACGSRHWYIEIAPPDAGNAAVLVGAYYGYF